MQRLFSKSFQMLVRRELQLRHGLSQPSLLEAAWLLQTAEEEIPLLNPLSLAMLNGALAGKAVSDIEC